jgi:hypothetical protein
MHCSYTTEVVKNTLDPVWRPFLLKTSQLASSLDSNFRMNVIDWDSIGSHDPIGHLIITPKVPAWCFPCVTCATPVS